MSEVKEKLLEAVSFETNNPDVAKRLKSHGTENASSVILHGEPGSGKTFILKALAAHMNLPLYEFKLSEQGSKFVHETTENIGKIFAQLKEKYQKTGEKSILLIDEFEDVAGKREGNDFAAHKQEETDALLKEISDAPKNGITVVAATNFYNKIDDAMKRPGRFVQIHVPHPDFKSRVDIIRKTLSRGDIAQNIANDNQALEKLSNITDGFSVADITETIKPFIKTSILKKIDKLSVDDFVELFSNFKTAKELIKENGK